MTDEWFFKKLAEISSNYFWYLNTENQIRARRIGDLDSQIKCYCPITAVSREMTGIGYEVDSVYNASQEIQMDEDTVINIVLATDFTNQQYEMIREKLFETLSLGQMR